MEGEILTYFKGYSPEVLLIALGSFILTYIVKKPIKMATNDLKENIREVVNVLIMFIPLILSFLATLFYNGIVTGEWLSLRVIDDALTSWLLSLTLYAIISKTLILLIGLKSGKITINSTETKEILTDINKTVKIAKKISSKDKRELKNIAKKIKTLISSRDLLLKDSNNIDLTKVSVLNQEIKELQNQEKEIKNNLNI